MNKVISWVEIISKPAEFEYFIRLKITVIENKNKFIFELEAPNGLMDDYCGKIFKGETLEEGIKRELYNDFGVEEILKFEYDSLDNETIKNRFGVDMPRVITLVEIEKNQIKNKLFKDNKVIFSLMKKTPTNSQIKEQQERLRVLDAKVEKRRKKANAEIKFIKTNNINQELVTSIEKFLKKNQEYILHGLKQDISEVNEVNKKLSNMIPTWFIELITKYPICGFGVVSDSDFTLSQIKDIYSDAMECYPGLKDKGYLFIGRDGIGDALCISVNEGDNPPVYRIYHDLCNNDADFILKEGKHLIVDKLSKIFV
jgi:hypothetical protein